MISLDITVQKNIILINFSDRGISMKPALWFSFVIFFFSASLSAVSPEQLNQQGRDLYRAGKYSQAAAQFRKALAMNPRYGWAYYNLACTLGAIRKKGNICEHGAFLNSIVDYLQFAAKYEPAVRKKFYKDPDLNSIRHTTGYQILLGYSLNNPAHLKLILERVPVWYGPAPGAGKSVSEIRLMKNGKVSYWFLSATPDHDSVKVTMKGTWRLRGTVIIITFDKALRGTRTYKGRLNKLGELRFEGIYGNFLDIPAECGS